jgi:predicted hydrocarbon binding protein
MTATLRPELGDFMSLICFQYLRQVAEETAGRALIITAGRQRGKDLAEQLGLLGTTQDAAMLREKLDQALGGDGTRLCLVQRVTPKADGGYEIRVAEGACAAGVTSSEPFCAFTMGVFIGAISAMTGRRMLGKESQCCATGASTCVYQIDPVG